MDNTINVDGFSAIADQLSSIGDTLSEIASTLSTEFANIASYAKDVVDELAKGESIASKLETIFLEKLFGSGDVTNNINILMLFFQAAGSFNMSPLQSLPGVLTQIGTSAAPLQLLSGDIEKSVGLFATLSQTIGGMMSPLTPFIAAFALLAGLFVFAYNNSENFRAGIEQVKIFLEPVGNVFKSIGEFIKKFGEEITEVLSILAILAGIAAIAFGATGLGLILVIGGGIIFFFQQLGAWANDSTTLIGSLWEGIKAFGEKAGACFAALIDAVDAFGENFRAWLGDAWESVKAFGEKIVAFFVGIWEGIKTFCTNAGELISNMLSAVVGFFISAGSSIKAALSVIDQIIGDAIAFVIACFTGFWENIKEGFSNFLSFLSEIGPFLYEHIVVPFMEALTFLFEFIGGIIDGIVEFFANFIQNALERFESFKETLVAIITNVCETVSAVFTTVFEAISTFFSEWIERITGVWDAFKTMFIETWTTLFSTVQEIFETIWNRITEIFETVTGVLKEAFETLKSSVTSIWENLWTGVKGFFMRTWNAIISGIESAANFVIDGINKIIEAYNSAISKLPGGNKITVSTIHRIALGRIPELATGGIPGYGQLFVAREAGAELIGGFGSQAGVMNNDQIVDSVSRGVYNAVKAAMPTGAQQGGEFELKVYLDGREIAATVEKHQKERGRTILPGGVAYSV